MTDTTVLVLAGGLGTRLSSISNGTPKILMPFRDKKFIDFKIEELREQGFDRLVFLTGSGSSQVKEHMSHRGYFYECIDDNPANLGTGGAILRASSILKLKNFFVTFGDNLLPYDAKSLMEFTETLDGSCVVASNWVGRADQRNLRIQGNKVTSYMKHDPGATHVDYGMHYYRSLDLPPYDGFSSDLGSILRHIAKNERLYAFVTNERYFEIGTVQTLMEAEMCYPIPPKATDQAAN